MGTEAKRKTTMLPTLFARGTGKPRLALPPPALDDVDAAWDAPLAPLASMLPPVVIAEALSSKDLIEDDDRPSDRATVPNELAPRRVRELSAMELDSSELEDDEDESARSLRTTRPPPPAHRPTLHDLASTLVVDEMPLSLALSHSVEPRRTPTMPIPHEQTVPMSVPPVSIDVRPPLTSLPGEMARSVPVSIPQVTPRNALLFIGSHLAVAATVLLWVWSNREPPRVAKREPRIVLSDRIGAGAPNVGSVEYAAPVEGCVVHDLARTIATRAELGPGLDAAALESGFGIGLASKPKEATGIRLEASTLRTAETVRVQSMWPVARVAIDRGSDPEDRIEVRLDGHETRTVTPSQRITALKGGVFAIDEAQKSHLLWGIPGAVPKTVETVRAVQRPDGGTVVAVRRSGIYWVGITGQGPMSAVIREQKTLGAPALAPVQGGAAMVWAERDTVAKGPFVIMTATIAPDGKRITVGEPAPVANGISPALATLPSGELLLVFSDGGAGAHRIVARRLGADLEPRGDLIVLSEQGTNAGSPAVAVDAEGRAIVAYLALDKGRAEVRATALSCH